jgi:hypothetical protein
VVKRKIPSPRRESNPRKPIVQPVAQHYTDWAITALIARMGQMRNSYNSLVGKPEGRRPVGRPTRRREDNIRMYHREMGWEGLDRMHLAQDTDQRRDLINMVMNLRVA